MNQRGEWLGAASQVRVRARHWAWAVQRYLRAGPRRQPPVCSWPSVSQSGVRVAFAQGSKSARSSSCILETVVLDGSLESTSCRSRGWGFERREKAPVPYFSERRNTHLSNALFPLPTSPPHLSRTP